MEKLFSKLSISSEIPIGSKLKIRKGEREINFYNEDRSKIFSLVRGKESNCYFSSRKPEESTREDSSRCTGEDSRLTSIEEKGKEKNFTPLCIPCTKLMVDRKTEVIKWEIVIPQEIQTPNSEGETKYDGLKIHRGDITNEKCIDLTENPEYECEGDIRLTNISQTAADNVPIFELTEEKPLCHSCSHIAVENLINVLGDDIDEEDFRARALYKKLTARD